VVGYRRLDTTADEFPPLYSDKTPKMTTLLIVYESANGEKAFPLAKVCNHDLLLAVAHSAIDEKRSEARNMTAVDDVLGTVAREEANRLERTLKALIPGFGLESETCPARPM